VSHGSPADTKQAAAMTAGEPTRLEELWAGRFGDQYIERNLHVSNGRQRFWSTVLTRHPVQCVLEVGCNIGANLEWICHSVAPRAVCGVDINARALERLRRRLPEVTAIRSTARAMPFRDDRFDLVFTAGVLIHQPEPTLPAVMREMVRCSRRYVLSLEYFAEETIEVEYRGHRGALFKRDYGRLYRELFGDLRLVEEGRLDKNSGWDDVAFWLFEKSRSLPVSSEA
jgi:pseudaminic acid biosynthesis-associated methylase